MITGDIGAEIARLFLVGAATGELPDEAARIPAAGTWRPAPGAAGGSPGTYATSVALALAGRTGRPAKRLAAYLAAGLAELAWISSARVTGAGYLTVSVTAGHLAGLAGRIVAAGAGAAASSAFAGLKLAAPDLPDPAGARDWEQAWRGYRDALSGRLAHAAGAEVLFFDIQQERAPESPTGSGSVRDLVLGPVTEAVAYYGGDAVRYALARTPSPRADAIARQLGRPLDLANPFAAVRYAHADAASTLRWAASLGLTCDAKLAAASVNDHLAAPELALLDIMSWLPEGVAAAVRRGRPAGLARYLEQLAQAWLDCREICPALPFYGSAAPAAGNRTQATARLGLAAAAQVVMAGGLGLLGVSAPERM